MALLPYRTEVGNGATVITDCFMNETAEAGVLVIYDTATTGVGSANDDPNVRVKLGTVHNGSGERPAGILLMDVVNKDLSTTHLNQYKRETQIGGKVAIAQRGTFVTNMISGGESPTPGQPAYFTRNGIFSTTSTNSTRVGTFMQGRNADGYAKINLTII